MTVSPVNTVDFQYDSLHFLIEVSIYSLYIFKFYVFVVRFNISVIIFFDHIM